MIYQDLSINKEPMVSLFIFTYNQEKIVSKTIDSLLAQKTSYSCEIIIAEDCSKDNTRNVCINYYKQYPNIIRLILNEENKGIIRNFHESIIGYARGKYIACVAGDDWWHDEYKIHKQVTFLEANPSYDLVYSNTLTYSQKQGKYLNYKPILDSPAFEQIIIQNCIPALTACYTKKIFESYVKDVDPVNVNFPGEDYPMWIWVAFKSKIHYINEPLTTYRVQEETLSHSNSKERQLQFEVDRLNIKLFFYNHFSLNRPEILHDIYLMFYFLTLNTASEAKNRKIENDREVFYKQNKYYLLWTMSVLNKHLSNCYILSSSLRFIMKLMRKFRVLDRYFKVYRKLYD